MAFSQYIHSTLNTKLLMLSSPVRDLVDVVAKPERHDARYR